MADYTLAYSGAEVDDLLGRVSSCSSITVTSVTIATNNWSSLSCTKTVSGVTTTNSVIVVADPASRATCAEANVYCSAQGTNSLTFSCDEVPSAAVTMNVMIIDSALPNANNNSY